MSQLGQGSLRFPTTRLLEADYGAVLAKQLHNDHVRAVESTFCGRNDGDGDSSLQAAHLQSCPSFLDGCGSSDRASLLRQLSVLKKHVSWREQSVVEARPLVMSLISAARKDPASTAHALATKSGCGPKITMARRRGKLQCAAPPTNQCDNTPLPLSRYCLHHQCLDSSQVLYRSCCSTSGGSSQEPCGSTVLDIFCSPPMCPKHSNPDPPPRKKTLLQQHSTLSGSKRVSKEMLGKLAVTGKAGGAGAVGKLKAGSVVKGGVIVKPGGMAAKNPGVLKTGGVAGKGVRKATVQPGSLLHNKVISLVKLKSAEIVADPKFSALPTSTVAVATKITAKVTSAAPKEPLAVKTTPSATATESTKSSTTLDDLTLSSSLTAPKLDLLPLKADIGDIMMAGEDSSEDDA